MAMASGGSQWLTGLQVTFSHTNGSSREEKTFLTIFAPTFAGPKYYTTTMQGTFRERK